MIRAFVAKNNDLNHRLATRGSAVIFMDYRVVIYLKLLAAFVIQAVITK